MNCRRQRLLAGTVCLLVWSISSIGPAAERSFEEALRGLVTSDPSLSSQSATLDAERVRLRPLAYHILPTVSFSADHTLRSVPGTESSPPAATSFGIQMRASLFRFGADVAQEDSAEFGILKQEAKLKSLQLKAEADAAASLIAAVAATMDLAIIRKLHATSEELLRVAKKQYQKGSLASQDVLKIEVDLGSSQTRLLEAQATVEKTEGMIAPYLGGDSVEKQWPLRDLVLSGASPLVRPQDLNSLEVPSEQSSPAIKAAALEVKEQEALVVAARARQRPSVDLTAGISSQLSNSSLSPPQAQAGISLSVPIFDRFEGASSTQAAIHLKQAAAANLEAQSRENVRAFNAARIALKAALLTIQTHERLLVAASSLYRDNLARFERGLVSVNELTLDQNRLLSAELAVSQSWRAVHEHLFDLCHAMGKGIKACLNKGAG